jgi:hypothetical protein
VNVSCDTASLPMATLDQEPNGYSINACGSYDAPYSNVGEVVATARRSDSMYQYNDCLTHLFTKYKYIWF